MLIGLLSVTQAVNEFRALTVLVFVSFTIIISWLVPHFVTDAGVLRRLTIVLLVSTALVCFFGLFQFAGDLIGLPPSLTGLRDLYTSEVFGFPRIQSTFLEPLYFANFLLIPLAIIISLLLAGQHVLRPIWLIALMLLAGVNFVLTLSRGGYIALAVTLLVLGAVYWKKVLTPHRILLAGLALLVIGAGAYQFLGLTGHRDESIDAFSRQATGLFTGASYADRATTIEDAWALTKAHPWLGVGIGNFGPSIATFPLVQPEGGWLIVNNEFVELAAEVGVFGLTVFVLLLLVLFIRSVRAIRAAHDPFVRALLVGLLAAFIGVIVQYQTFSILYIMHVWFLFGLMVAAQNIVLANQKTHV
jgi:O-antigen ligase